MTELKISLIKRDPDLYGNPPSFDVMEEFEDTICKVYPKLEYVSNNSIMSPLVLKALITKIGISTRALTLNNKINYLSIQMGPDFGKILPYCLRSKNSYAYFFDIWPKFFDEMENFLTNSSINHVFLSSQYTTNYFNLKGYENVSWIPEGISPQIYKYCSFKEKDIDVLELGRKFQSIHEKIRGVLEDNSKKHFYEKTNGEIVFPNKKDFILGMARSKISICFPKSETHPDVAGKINTMTNRYLQSMASKCLIVGSAPEEMKYLFGFDPVIQLSKDKPGEHLLDILNHYEDYHDLIEQNYKYVIKNHTWESRCKNILQVIEYNKINNKFTI